MAGDEEGVGGGVEVAGVVVDVVAGVEEVGFVTDEAVPYFSLPEVSCAAEVAVYFCCGVVFDFTDDNLWFLFEDCQKMDVVGHNHYVVTFEFFIIC